ncbi:MAG: hypothetical protein AB4368_04180 [Xenococcaceae cyanobacterium]
MFRSRRGKDYVYPDCRLKLYFYRNITLWLFKFLVVKRTQTIGSDRPLLDRDR